MPHEMGRIMRSATDHVWNIDRTAVGGVVPAASLMFRDPPTLTALVSAIVGIALGWVIMLAVTRIKGGSGHAAEPSVHAAH